MVRSTRTLSTGLLFYSDCEYEVLEVTQGYRLTLAYKLYYVCDNGQLGGNY